MIEMIIVALLFGLAFGFIYDFFKLINCLFVSSAVTFVTDVLFSLVFALGTFCFFIAFNDGKIRVLPIIIEFCGFFAYRASIGMVISRFIGAICKGIRKCTYFVVKKVNSFVKNVKKVLQTGYKVLYNNTINKQGHFIVPKTKLKKKDNKTTNEKYIQE